VAVLYGATIQGVQDLIPTFTITRQTEPNLATVGRWLDESSSIVALSLGDLTRVPTASLDLVTVGAASLVHLRTAALTDMAAHPEHAASRDESSYGQQLMARFDAELATLGSVVEELVSGSAELGGIARPGVSFPQPTFTLDQQF
jgi:hypothetical protein